MSVSKKTVVVTVISTVAVRAAGLYLFLGLHEAIDRKTTRVYLRQAVTLAERLEVYRKEHGSYPIAWNWLDLNEQIESFRVQARFEEGLTYLSDGNRYLFAYAANGWGPYVMQNGKWISPHRIIDESELRIYEGRITDYRSGTKGKIRSGRDAFIKREHQSDGIEVN